MYEYLRDDVWAEIVCADGVDSETDVDPTGTRGFIPNLHVNIRGHLTRLTLLGLSVDVHSLSNHSLDT